MNKKNMTKMGTGGSEVQKRRLNSWGEAEGNGKGGGREDGEKGRGQ